MNLRHFTLVALGFGATTVLACGGTPTLDTTLEAAVKAAPAQHMANHTAKGVRRRQVDRCNQSRG